MDPDLVALLALQERDQAVAAIEGELKALDPEVTALDAQLAIAEGELTDARKGVEEAGSRRVELEGKIEGYRVMQERRRQRLEWVRGAKEAATLMAELDLARSVLAKEEAEWIRSADRVQEAAPRNRVIRRLTGIASRGHRVLLASIVEYKIELVHERPLHVGEPRFANGLGEV